MKAAVTGATGFVGRHLVAELIRAGHAVSAVVRPTSDLIGLNSASIAVAALDDATSLATAFDCCDVVYHLAGAVDFGDDRQRFRQVNVGGTANVIAAARKSGVRRLVHCSSIVAVGASLRPLRLDESARWNLGGLNVPYVNTKREAEELALAATGPNLETVVANLACVVGPGDHAGSEFGTICRRFWRGNLPIHFGGGNNFVDVRDVANGLRLCADQGRAGERYILGGTNRTMTAFFSELARAAGRMIPRLRLPSPVGWLTARLEKQFATKKRSRAYLTAAQAKLLPYFFFYDCSKAERELGFIARSLSETLSDAHADWRLQRRSA